MRVEKLDQRGAQKIVDAVRSHALRVGGFEQEAGHEPARGPSRGLSTAVVLRRIAPYRGGSGLNATSIRLELVVRIYLPAVTRPCWAPSTR